MAKITTRIAGKTDWLKETGINECVAKLQGLPQNIHKRVLRSALNKAMTPVIKASRRENKDDTGAMDRAMGKKVKLYSKAAAGLVGARTKHIETVIKRSRLRDNFYMRRVTVRPSKYLHLIFGGTKPHDLGKGRKLKPRNAEERKISEAAARGNQHPGTKANRFLVDALTSTSGESMRIMQVAVADGIDKYWRTHSAAGVLPLSGPGLFG